MCGSAYEKHAYYGSSAGRGKVVSCVTENSVATSIQITERAMRKRWIVGLLILGLVGTVPAEEMDEAGFQSLELVLSIDKLFGAYTFWRQTDAGYETGFLEFNHDHTWTFVTHLDRDRDRVADERTVRKGEYDLGKRDDGTAGFYLTGEGQPKEFLGDLRMIGGKAQSFVLQGRAFARRQADDPYFRWENDLPDLAKDLFVESDPAGALVYVDGEEVPGVTPVLITKPRANTPLSVKVVYPGHQPIEQAIKLAVNEEGKLKVTLVKGDAGLKVTSLPRVQVYLDGSFVGQTPVTLDQLAAGQHTIEIRNDALNISRQEKIFLEKGKQHKQRYRFTGRLVVEVGRHCTIYRFDRKVGETPYDAEVPIGHHSLILVDDKGERRRVNLAVELGQTVEIKNPFDALPKAE
jgi:hypothetical protein